VKTLALLSFTRHPAWLSASAILLLYAVVLNLGAKARHCFSSCAYALPWQRSMPSGDWESRVVAGVFEFSCFGIAGRISLGKSLVSHETSREQNARIAVLQGKFFSKTFLAWQTIEGKLGHLHHVLCPPATHKPQEVSRIG
jgi:hypothetical protein